ncbi:hypothetical protein AcV5_002248 [Taiwanofungus camphoratus]|nr:hypothetical protein AcV5_002248 [Antrodia cinnamomea]
MPDPPLARDVYAEQLLRCGHGFPLWDPQPTKHGEVLIGDVGFFHEGTFYRLFNAIRSADDDANHWGVPRDYKPFVPKSDWGSVTDHAAIPADPPLCSTSINCTSLNAQVTIQGSGGGLQFECNADQGAILVMKDPANREALLPSRRMANYMRSNYNSWYVFATDTLDQDIQKEDLIFVRGYAKTTQWAVAAFIQEGRSMSLALSGSFASTASASLSFSVTRGSSMNAQHKSGPRPQAPNMFAPRITAGTQTSTGSIASTGPKFNQCIFLNYYKLKVRFGLWPSVMKAAGERHDETFFGDEEGNSPQVAVDMHDPMSEDVIVEQVPAPRKPYDPVDFVLEYILSHSNAEVAIANDADIFNLCQGREVPENIPEFLNVTQPLIEVNDDGLGMLSFDDLVLSETMPETEEAASQSRHVAEDKTESRKDIAPDDRNMGKDFEGGIQFGTGLGDTGGICALAYSPNGLYIATGSEDKTIIIWEVNTSQRLRECTHHDDTIGSVAFSPDSTELVSGSRDGLVIIWTVATGQPRAILEGHRGFVHSVAYSPDGSKIASASVDFTVRIWNAATGTPRAVSSGHRALVMLVAFSPNGRWIVSGSADHSARVWDAETGAEQSMLEGHEGVVCSLAFAPDSRRLVTGSDDGTARIWIAETGDELVTLREHRGSVWATAFSPDGKKVLSAASDGTIRVCDSFTGDQLVAIDGGDSLLNAAAFSADGKRICASGGDNAVRVYSAETGATLATLAGHSDKVSLLKFSPDGDHIVSSSDDSTLRIWDLNAAWVADS